MGCRRRINERNEVKRFLSAVSAVLFVLTMTTAAFASEAPAQQDDIVVLYTNDVHCAVTEGMGYAGLAAYVKHMEQKTPYVTVVDCGDAIQGEAVGTVSEGGNIVDIMNKVGYDLAVLGNHDFDYGMERLAELLDRSTAQYLGANVSYTGTGESIADRLKPYEILSYGDTDVAFIGLSTPSETPSAWHMSPGRRFWISWKTEPVPSCRSM